MLNIPVLYCMYIFTNRPPSFTYYDDVAEGVPSPDGRAVPPVVSELLLALQGGQPYSIPHGYHGVWRRTAHVSLARGQSGHSAADDVGSQRHYAGHHPGTTSLYQYGRDTIRKWNIFVER